MSSVMFRQDWTTPGLLTPQAVAIPTGQATVDSTIQRTAGAAMLLAAMALR